MPKRIVATQAQAAKALKIAARTFATWLASGCPCRVDGGYDVGVARQWDKARKAFTDPLLGGPNSPALEEYRRWRAAREKLAYERDQGKWVPIDEMIQCLGVFSATIRGGMMALQREWPAAFKVMAEAFQDAAEVFERGLHNGADGRILDDPPAGSNGDHPPESGARAGGE
jgi:hypothetical protein